MTDEQREARNAYVREWRKKNPDKWKTIAARSAKKHRKECNARRRTWEKTHRENVNAIARRYYAKHREEILAREKKRRLEKIIDGVRTDDGAEIYTDV